MAKLYFRYGAMGSSKTANALMVAYNYFERGKTALLVKPKLENRDGCRTIRSRIGLSQECVFLEELAEMPDEKIELYDCIIVDEAQFATKAQVEHMVHIVNDLEIPVICYGLRTDFQMNLFEDSMWLLAWADRIEEIKTACWCGQGASCNARINADGKIVRNGDQIVLGGNDSYVSLCRIHYKEGRISKESKIS